MQTSTSLVCRMKPYIQPFERKLALRELVQLTGSELRQRSEDPNYFVVESRASSQLLIDNLAYWESVEDGRFYWTKQLKREATTYLIKNGIKPSELIELLPFTGNIPVPNRRCLRYGPHDIHEYRGKFFPQLVRALLNICDLPANSTVLDPMCLATF
jgi:hypothetical protein